MVTVRKKRDIQMTEGPVLGKIIRFMLPLMVTNLLQVFYNAADMMVVELSGVADAVGAVGVTSSFVTLITNIFIGFSVGANVLVARNIGAKNEEGVSRAVHTAVCMSLVFGLVGGAVGISVSKPVLTWMGTPESLLKLSSTYTYIYFAGIPFISIANYLISIFRAKGDTRTPLLVLMLSGLLNVALNLFFVLVCHLSVEGVSLATVISNAASAAVLILILRRDEGPCRFSFKKLRISKDAFREIIAIGLPAGVQGALFSISNMLIQSSILQVNDRMVAELGVPVDYEPVVKGNAATLSLENFAFTAVNAVHQAAVTFTGQNAGAKRFDRVKRVMGACYLVEGCVALLIALAAVAVLVATLWLPVLQIYGSSMTPTLWDGEIVFSVKTTDMEQGDIIAFYYNNKILVKRVIAGPGDWVDITEDGTVYINGAQLEEPYLEEKAFGDADIEFPYQVPDGRIFVMGDHRATSVDSRHMAVGCVAEEQIVGKIVFRVWPVERLGLV